MSGFKRGSSFKESIKKENPPLEEQIKSIPVEEEKEDQNEDLLQVEDDEGDV
jgi:hypothetical protein